MYIFFFPTGNIKLKQDMGIPVEIDPAPFWANLLHFYENQFMNLFQTIKLKVEILVPQSNLWIT